MKQKRMLELIDVLNDASRAYYLDSKEIMSNFEFDKLYDELVVIENQLGVTLANSPTVKVGYEILSELPKEAHETPMLSLDKSKEISRLIDFAGDKSVLLSWKLDGLTIVLTYEDGTLIKAVTRGNGEIGEVISNNAKTFKNLPLNIPYKGKLVLRGEAVIGYEDFDKINEGILEVDSKYKNPRNLCSGSVRQLNNEVTAKRNVKFFAFGLVSVEDVEFENSRNEELKWLKEQGFEVVEYMLVDANNMYNVVEKFKNKIASNEYPSDGLVLIYDDIAYGDSLGSTAKFPRNAFAFKWEDEVKETTLIEVEWSASRTGLINPVAIFDPVDLEGTIVSRASVHNVSIVEELELGIGDKIQVYKANMIIPQIAENLSRSGSLVIPKSCPVCNQVTQVKQDAEAKVLMCLNEQCQAKLIKSFALFVSRNALNVEGLSEATIEKLVDQKIFQDFEDIFHIAKYQERIESLEGFGAKSFNKLKKNIEAAKNTTLAKVLYGLGIANIGLSNAKMICKAFHNDVHRIINATKEELNEVDGVGEVIAETFTDYFSKDTNRDKFLRLLSFLKFEEVEASVEQILEGKTFVITGSVELYKNRNEIKEVIERLGGKVAGSVSSKTNYLINNDMESGSSKNKKARELDIPIISEMIFNELINS